MPRLLLQTLSRIQISLKVSIIVLKGPVSDPLVKETRAQIVGKTRSKSVPFRQLARVAQKSQGVNIFAPASQPR